MTPSEFKAWFEGFCEGMEGLPSVKQWERIKARVAEIDGKPVTATVFVDRYWPLYPRSPYNDMYWPWHRAYAQCSGGAQQFQNVNLAGQGMQAGQGTQQANVANQMGQNFPNQVGQNEAVYRAAVQSAQSGRVLNAFDSEEAMRQLGRKDRSDLN